MNHVLYVFLLGVILALSACTAYSLSTMDSELGNLVTRRDALRKEDPTGAESVLASSDATLLALSADAEKAAADTDRSLPTRIAFLRIATTAAWKAGQEGAEAARDLSDQGWTLCEQMVNAKQKPPPRDCALFVMIPALVHNDQATRQIHAWRPDAKQLPPTYTPEKAAKMIGRFDAVEEAVESYGPATIVYLESNCPRLEKLPTLPEDLLGYGRKSLEIFANNAEQFYQITQAMRLSDVNDPKLEVLQSDAKKARDHMSKRSKQKEVSFLPVDGACPTLPLASASHGRSPS